MRNERNAGRKSKIDDNQLDAIKARIDAGESVSVIAAEYGVSRQALYKRLKPVEETLVLDYVVDDEVSTRIEIDIAREAVRIINYAKRISDRAFGLKKNPDWDDLKDFLEKQYIKTLVGGADTSRHEIICKDVKSTQYSLDELIDKESSDLITASDCDANKMPVFSFTRKDILYSRTDTAGYQLKALSHDRMIFVKSQAIIAGKLMDDWRVEVLASDICRQLNIGCVEQRECDFYYGTRKLKGVYSKNFEIDGYTFVSFESLLERSGLSTKEDYFIKLGAIDKLEWCARMLAQIGGLPYESTLKYMQDLALVDCIVGNVDRHTRNMGLFFDSNEGIYRIPLLFDNGMGLFEHDSYKDEYGTFDEAMMSVYVAPYGEDPFDMYRLMDEAYDCLAVYPKLKTLKIDTSGLSPFAREYIERIQGLWQK